MSDTLKEVILAEINFCESKNFAFSKNLFSRIGFFEIFISQISDLKKCVVSDYSRFWWIFKQKIHIICTQNGVFVSSPSS